MVTGLCAICINNSSNSNGNKLFGQTHISNWIKIVFLLWHRDQLEIRCAAVENITTKILSNGMFGCWLLIAIDRAVVEGVTIVWRRGRYIKGCMIRDNWIIWSTSQICAILFHCSTHTQYSVCGKSNDNALSSLHAIYIYYLLFFLMDYFVIFENRNLLNSPYNSMQFCLQAHNASPHLSFRWFKIFL